MEKCKINLATAGEAHVITMYVKVSFSYKVRRYFYLLSNAKTRDKKGGQNF